MKRNVTVCSKYFRIGSLALLAALLCFFTTTSASATCTVGSELVNSCGPWIGAAANDYTQASTGLQNQMIYHEQRVGRQMSIVHAYNSVGANSLTTDELFYINRANTHLLLNWKPAAHWADAAGGNATVNAGIDAMANAIKAVAPKKIFFSVYHEPQNDVSANNPGDTCTLSGSGTAGTPADYVNMWHNVRTRFNNLSVTNVVWVIIYQGYTPLDCLIPKLYPGGPYVNWIASDVYDTGAGWNADVSHVYNLFNTNGWSFKPYMIAEFGIHGARPQSEAYQFYADAKASIDAGTYPNIEAYVVWDAIGAKFNQVEYGGPGPVSNPSNYFLDATEQTDYNAFANDTHLQ